MGSEPAVNDAWPLHRGFQKPQNVKKDQSAFNADFISEAFTVTELRQETPFPPLGCHAISVMNYCPLKLLTGTSPQL